MRWTAPSLLLVLLGAGSATADPRWWTHDRALTNLPDGATTPDVALAVGETLAGTAAVVVVAYTDIADRGVWLLVSPDFGCTWCEPKAWTSATSAIYPKVEAAVLPSGLLSIQVVWFPLLLGSTWVTHDSTLDLADPPAVFCDKLAQLDPTTERLPSFEANNDCWCESQSVAWTTDGDALTHFHAGWSCYGPFCMNGWFELASDLTGDGSWSLPGREIQSGGMSAVTADRVSASTSDSSVSLFYLDGGFVKLLRSNRSGLPGSFGAPPVEVGGQGRAANNSFSLRADSSTSDGIETGAWSGAVWRDVDSHEVVFDAAYWDGPPGLTLNPDFVSPGDLLVSGPRVWGLDHDLSIGPTSGPEPTGLFIYWNQAEPLSEVYYRGGVLDPAGSPPRDLDRFPFAPARIAPPDPTLSVPSQLSLCSWDETTGACTPQPRDPATEYGAWVFGGADARGFDLPATYAVVFGDDRTGLNQIYLKMTDGSVAAPALHSVTPSCSGLLEAQAELRFGLVAECPATPVFPPELIERYLLYYGGNGLGGPFPTRVELPNQGLSDPTSVVLQDLAGGKEYAFVVIAEDQARNINPADFDPGAGGNNPSRAQSATATLPPCSPDLELQSCVAGQATCAGVPQITARPGDDVELAITLTNDGDWPASSISGWLEASGARVLSPPDGDLASLGLDIPSGGNVDIPVTIRLDPECPTPPDPGLDLVDLASDGGLVSFTPLACPAPVVSVDCGGNCDTGCDPASLPVPANLRAVSLSAGGAHFIWDMAPGPASEVHVNAVESKQELFSPALHRPPVPGGLAEARCDGFPPSGSCVDRDAFVSPPPLLFYRAVAACGPSGSEEGPF